MVVVVAAVGLIYFLFFLNKKPPLMFSLDLFCQNNLNCDIGPSSVFVKKVDRNQEGRNVN